MLDFANTDWNFPIEEHPLIVNGQRVDGWKAIVNGVTGTPIHIHRESYRVLTNNDVVNATYDAVKSANISADFDFEVRSLDDGRKLKIDVLFNDLVTEPAKGDYVKFRLRGLNSYDGSWSYQIIADALRLFCLNGCVTPDLISRVYARHTTNINIEGTAVHIVNGLETFHHQRDRWRRWMGEKVDNESVEGFFKAKLVARPTKTSDESINKKQLEALMGGWTDEKLALGANKSALYNCMTAWATHVKSKSAHNVILQREAAVAAAINSKAWATL